MIHPHAFFDLLSRNGIEFYAGVPDSLLKHFCAYVSDQVASDRHVIAANEGGAMAVGLGYYLATGKIPLVYMQNSGLGNSINPLLSLCDPDVYSIPTILLIGWRGEPGLHDEPQHRKQGRVMLPLLEAVEIPYCVLPPDAAEAESVVEAGIGIAGRDGLPYAFVVRRGTFEPFALIPETAPIYTLSREDAIKVIVDSLEPSDIVVATTGMVSRELFEYRAARCAGHAGDFLTVGGMGHASQIALGVAMQRRDRLVYCLDGDGAAIMHMGSLAISGQSGCGNLKHVVLNNGAHDSVGGQPTVGFSIEIPTAARSMGYEVVRTADCLSDLEESLIMLRNTRSPGLLEVRVRKGARADLGRPTTTPNENKLAFMGFVQ